jgi:hypothetical protein
MRKTSLFSPETRATADHVAKAIAWSRQLETEFGDQFVDKLVQDVEMRPPWTRKERWTLWHVNTFVQAVANHVLSLPSFKARYCCIPASEVSRLIPPSFVTPASDGTDPLPKGEPE